MEKGGYDIVRNLVKQGQRRDEWKGINEKARGVRKQEEEKKERRRQEDVKKKREEEDNDEEKILLSIIHN